MKKIIIFILGMFLVGCSCSNPSASDTVKEYLNNYTNLSDNVLKDIDELVKEENLTDEEKAMYKEILKREYSNLVYIIENETYDGDTAEVTVKITVFDLYKAGKAANEYLQAHPEEFLTDGEYDADKYRDYKLAKMKSMEDTISYNIVFKVNKVSGDWQLEQPDAEVLEKIHGIYNYEK